MNKNRIIIGVISIILSIVGIIELNVFTPGDQPFSAASLGCLLGIGVFSLLEGTTEK